MQPDQEEPLPISAPEPTVELAPPTVVSTGPSVFWSYIDLAWLIGIAFAGMVVLNLLALALATLTPGLRQSGPFLLLLQFVLYAFIYLGFFFVFRMRYGQPVMHSLGWRPSRFGFGMAALTGIVLAVVVQSLAVALHTPEKSPVEPFTKTPFSLALVVVMAVVAAPLFEELFFRGFLQPLLTRDLGAVAGVLITGALFGALHLFEYGNLWQYGLAITLVGVTLGYIRLRTGSVVPSTLVHACFNSVSVFALVASKLSRHS